mmetsp:Transcript_101942/g.283687  ORF Transcript_101942/g.283687 Transcript_101942/m.283687 type:complete len:154 (+) Transcript_101942:95-556(+)
MAVAMTPAGLMLSVEGSAPNLKPKASTTWERLLSDASTAEPPASDDGTGNDNEGMADDRYHGAEAGGPDDEKGEELEAVASVGLALVVLAVALLAWLHLPALVFSALLAFAALEVLWFAHVPSTFATPFSGCLLLPCCLCGCMVFLACQTPQL